MPNKLREAGFVVAENGALCSLVLDKEGVRQLHKPASQLEIAARQDWLRRYLPEYLSFFANGDEIVPERVT
ncbi:MAG: type I restriction endonuclease subunit M, partial [Acidobacteria bacterium]